LASEHLERRLTAILAADVAGYSRLTGLDEEGTHLQLREHLSSFVNPKIAEYRGRIVKNTGDGLLAEFSSAVDAVRCAIDVQRGMAKRNADVAAEKRIDFRIGINIGDIIIDRGDIFGDGVNVAARLEGVADPGGICMSDDVFRQIQGRVAGDFVDIGEQQLKNIARPVRIFHVRVTGPATDASPLDTSSLPALPPGTELRFPNGARSAETVAYSGKVFAFTNIPIRVPTHFMGRDDALAVIETALKRYEGRVAITALHGLRGVGKTTLAAAFAERHRGDYRATWWIRAQSDTTMRADLMALGIRLGWVGVDEKEEQAVAAVMERLRYEGNRILLIFDNAVDADALKPYLPLGGAVRVLVTSNAPVWRGVAAPVEIRLWPKEIGADYLIARTGRTGERPAAEALSEALGGLPLAHEQAAAFCERLDISLANYRKRFEVAPARLLDDARHAPAEYHDGLTVAKTFALAIEEAAKLHPAAEPLIVHAALLAPEPIPLFLFSEASEKFGEPLASMFADDGLDEAVAALRAFALVDREAIVDERDASITTAAIRLHRLVREVAVARREGEERSQLRLALAAALGAAYPSNSYSTAAWPRCAPLTPHLLANCEAEIDVNANAECADLLDRAGMYFHCRAAYSGARPLYERALAIRANALGPEHPHTALSLHHLANLLRSQGDYAGAQPLYERALAIREKAFGPEHTETAASLVNLALLLRDRGDHAGARPLMERALAIREKVLGPDHPDTAWSLNPLAVLLRDHGDYAGAQQLFERALAIHEKALGPQHPGTAWSLTHVAVVLQAQADYRGARPLCERALAIREKALGPEHPETAGSLQVLARLLQDQGDLAGARPLVERALAIREKALGPDHPHTALSLNHLANLLRSEGDVAGARPLCERALAIHEKVLDPDHLDTASTLHTLALLLHDQGDLARARPLCERALAIREKALGTEHPDTAWSLHHLANLLRSQGDLAGARPLCERALAIREKALGPDHPHTALSLNHLANLLRSQGDVAGARPLCERALAIHEKAGANAAAPNADNTTRK
jgi:class 3 adenylate cyclase/tetratricopeptide (TPR) repeat protein